MLRISEGCESLLAVVDPHRGAFLPRLLDHYLCIQAVIRLHGVGHEVAVRMVPPYHLLAGAGIRAGHGGAEIIGAGGG